MSKAIEIQPTRLWPSLSALFWAAEAVLGAGIAGAGVIWIEHEPPLLTLGLIGGGLLLALVGSMMCAFSLIAMTARGPLLRFSREGLTDARVSPDLIPWEGLRWGVYYAGKGTSSIQFSTPAPIRLRWAMRVMGLPSRLFGMPPLTLMSLGTGLSLAELSGLMSQFRPPET